MNVPVTAPKLIDRAILLEEGGAIVVPCSSYEEMEKLRVRLYKLKQQLQGSYRDIALSLDIRRRVSTNRWTIFITKDVGFSGVFILEGGEAKPFDLQEEEKEKEAELPPEEELEEKELAPAPAPAPVPEDFDDVAAEIERTQGLTEEKEEDK